MSTIWYIARHKFGFKHSRFILIMKSKSTFTSLVLTGKISLSSDTVKILKCKKHGRDVSRKWDRPIYYFYEKHFLSKRKDQIVSKIVTILCSQVQTPFLLQVQLLLDWATSSMKLQAILLGYIVAQQSIKLRWKQNQNMYTKSLVKTVIWYRPVIWLIFHWRMLPTFQSRFQMRNHQKYIKNEKSII